MGGLCILLFGCENATRDAFLRCVCVGFSKGCNICYGKPPKLATRSRRRYRSSVFPRSSLEKTSTALRMTYQILFGCFRLTLRKKTKTPQKGETKNATRRQPLQMFVVRRCSRQTNSKPPLCERKAQAPRNCKQLLRCRAFARRRDCKK